MDVNVPVDVHVDDTVDVIALVNGNDAVRVIDTVDDRQGEAEILIT